MTTPQDSIHPVGSIVWNRGDAVTITTEPYIYSGGEFQDGTTEDGRTVSIATPRFLAEQATKHREDWQRQQATFRRLRAAAEVQS